MKLDKVHWIPNLCPVKPFLWPLWIPRGLFPLPNPQPHSLQLLLLLLLPLVYKIWPRFDQSHHVGLYRLYPDQRHQAKGARRSEHQPMPCSPSASTQNGLLLLTCTKVQRGLAVACALPKCPILTPLIASFCDRKTISILGCVWEQGEMKVTSILKILFTFSTRKF